jgi:FHA domain
MPKLVVSIDGVIIKEVPLSKDRTTIGRRPYNDVVIDNLAVSGEHAAVLKAGEGFGIEDLGSTNGTYVNGTPVKKQGLRNGDTIEIGKYKIRFLADAGAGAFEETMVADVPQAAVAAGVTVARSAAPKGSAASVRVLNGAAAGRVMPLTKVVTTIGKPGVAVAALTHRPQGYIIARVDGTGPATVNGRAIGGDPVALSSGDMLEIGGIQMEFVQG